MSATGRSQQLKKDIFGAKLLGSKPVLFSESARPSGLALKLTSIGWSAAGTAVAASNGAGIRVWNPEKANVKASVELRGHTGAVEKLEWSPAAADVLASTGADSTVRVWDVRVGGGAAGLAGKGSAVGEFKMGDQGLYLTWTQDGNQIVAGRRDDVMMTIDVRTMRMDEGRKMGFVMNQMTFSNGGDELFACASDGSFRALDWPTLDHLHTTHAHSSACYAIQHSPSGSYLAVGGGDALISLWDTHDWCCPRTLASLAGPVKCVSFSFDGNYLCGASDDKDTHNKGIDVFHVGSGDVVATLDTAFPVNQVAWHPSRYWLAYAGDAGGLKIVGTNL
ncbi:hypothetical protein LTR28_008507 [Elasticomyces elasticus]|nr:hypothetical protein LTR28_008507 [Elasticomyces elasticus]